MAVKIAINGYGRVGRAILRAVYEMGRADRFRVFAINDLGDTGIHAHLTRHDTAHGPFPGSVEVSGDDLLVNGDPIRVFSERDPAKLPWGELGVDLVMECTGAFRGRDKASAHLDAGAGRVLISAPAGDDVDATVVYGVNHEVVAPGHRVVSNASCTTNCLAPLVKPLHEALGVEHGIMTTVHAYTNDQVLSDVYHKDPRRARAAAQNQIPTTTGATRAVEKVLPELAGRLDGYALRVPTINVSLVDFTFTAGRDTDSDEVNALLRAAADGPLAGILGCSEEPLVSSDFMHDPRSAVVDLPLTRVTGNRLVKVCAWYDNEWAFAVRMLDVGEVMVAH
ncbi:type I glyceraldehyde-3-phosphate dehydrogenase [Arhodomonas sp. SL1]|uniref:type I glyceraldehyde-3-phosphate dehydrogenase n=1 Tax=Arhodomonas sp. SL1 TaxID=3425691 RepID=UPI003F885925